MLVWLEQVEIDELTRKRAKLKAKLDEMISDGIKLDMWVLDDGDMVKKPLLLLARLKYTVTNKPEYKLIMSNPGANGVVHVWQCPGVLPGAEVLSKGGRPTKFGDKAKEQAKALKEAGLSIRKIAAEMDCSTFTVQRLLKP